MSSPYNYVRFRWWTPVDIDKTVEEFSGYESKVIMKDQDGMDLSLSTDYRGEIMIKADTLQVFISPFRAILNQKEAKPFTTRDLVLREKILKLYPRDRPTPFPWSFNDEPKFKKGETT